MYSIIDNQENFLVIGKYPNIGFHKSETDEGLIHLLKRDLSLDSLFPVHRLDKPTSGILVFAKNKESNRELSKQFQERRVEKYYIALAKGKPKKKQGTIIGDMTKSRRGAWKLLTTKNNPAITQFFSFSVEPGLRLYLLKLITGKTHQLRVALKSQGVPVYGDALYGGEDMSLVDRCYLHAYWMSFSLLGKEYTYRFMPEHGDLFSLDSVITSLDTKLANPNELNWPVLKTNVTHPNSE